MPGHLQECMHVRLGGRHHSAPGCWTAQLHGPATATGSAGAAARAKAHLSKVCWGQMLRRWLSLSHYAQPAAKILAMGAMAIGQAQLGREFSKNVLAWSEEGLPAWGRLEGMHRRLPHSPLAIHPTASFEARARGGGARRAGGGPRGRRPCCGGAAYACTQPAAGRAVGPPGAGEGLENRGPLLPPSPASPPPRLGRAPRLPVTLHAPASLPP